MSPSGQDTLISPDKLKDRIVQVQERINQAASTTGRSGSDITLVAVTKTIPVQVINQALALGLDHVGENKVQEAEAKKSQIEKKVTHHFLGGLQTNKARKAVKLFDCIQSVDRPRLAEALNRIAGEEGKKQACLIEVKVSDEATKSGIPWEQATNFISGFSQYENLELQGLMTIAGFDLPEDVTRQSFIKMKKLFDDHQKQWIGQPILSMGMTDDFEWAIKEGSTMVRVGRAIFGERQ